MPCSMSSLHWPFSCFLCHFSSTVVCSDYTSSLLLRHRYLFHTFQKERGPTTYVAIFKQTRFVLVFVFIVKIQIMSQCTLPPCESKKMDSRKNYDIGGMGRYSRNILQWNYNNIKSRKITNGDYSMLLVIQ